MSTLVFALGSLACGRVASDCENCGPSGGDGMPPGEEGPGTGGAGSGGAVSGGTGSAGGDDSCSVSECDRGTRECDPDSGVLRDCGSCGEWVPTTQPCVRELAMDQESNVACGVVGGEDVVCFSTTSALKTSRKIPRAFKSLILPDDALNLAISTSAFSPMCTLAIGGKLECDRSAGALVKTGCSSASLSDQGGELVCGVCAGDAFCEGNLSSPSTSAQSFAVADGMVSYIDKGAIYDVTNTPRTFSGLRNIFRSNDGTLCGFEQSGGVRCVKANGDTISLAKDLFEASVGDEGFLCGVDPRGLGSCQFLDPSNPAPEPVIELEGIRHFRASVSTACALTFDGVVICFDQKGNDLEVPSELD